MDAQTGRPKDLRGDDGSDLEGDLVQGKHGSLYLEQNGWFGLYLPQLDEPLVLE